MVDLQQKHVLITGASYGIGAATARAFGRRGAHVRCWRVHRRRWKMWRATFAQPEARHRCILSI
jgi:NAD(P)-dependent dehydrogenase (short-subunit alcohol dehydrogenase family)